VCEAACERHEALETRQLARWLGAPLNEDTLEASHQRAAGREGQPTMRAARSRARSRAVGVRWGATEDGLSLEHLQQVAQHVQVRVRVRVRIRVRVRDRVRVRVRVRVRARARVRVRVRVS
jgi:hypothetical protein